MQVIFRAVDQSMRIWQSRRMSYLKLQFFLTCLGMLQHLFPKQTKMNGWV